MVKTRRFCLGTTTLFGLGVASSGLSAGDVHAGPETAAAPAQLCHDDPSRAASTLTYLACSLRDGLPPLGRKTVVVSRPLVEGSPDGSRAFASRLTLLLSNATGTQDGGVASGPNPQSDPESVLLLEPQLHGTLVQVNATLIGKRASVWARLRGESNQVLAHSFASKPIDTEVRSYLPRVPLVRPTVATYATPLSQINAIACGDIDADGALDLALANRQDITVGNLTQAGFTSHRMVSLGELSAVAPVPLREPLAALWFNGRTLEASTTDRHYWLQLDSDLGLLSKRLNQRGVAPGLCASRSTPASLAATFDCQSPPKLTDASSPLLDRLVSLGERDAKRQVVAWRDATSTSLTIQTPSRTWSLPERGAQIAIGDLDRDGTLEVLSTSATLTRSEDRISIHSLPDSAGEPVLLWELPVSTGVDALAICPEDSLGQSAIVFASNDHVGVAQ